MPSQTIEVDYFKDLSISYKVINLEIEEAISEVTNINLKIFFFFKNIWEINIPLKTEINITIIEDSEEKLIKKYKCFVKDIKKTKSLDEKSPLFNEYFLEINASHNLGKLAYSNNFYLWKNKSAYEVIKDILLKHNLSLDGNFFQLDDFKKELIVQYGENDLHFFERILQFLGFFYLCEEDSNIIKVYNTPLGYEEISPIVEIYEINLINNYRINTIKYLNEFNTLSQEKFIHRDVNYYLPLKLEATTLNDNISYGDLYTYPSNSDNLQKISKSPINKKNQFISKKYEGVGYCFKFSPSMRVKINHINDEDTYVITYVKHLFMSNTLSNTIGTNYNYYNEFKLKNASETFVTNKILKKPLVSSMEVAIVKPEAEGEEVSFLNYEKVLIKFNWTDDDKAFYVWVPVAQYMAGKVFGSFIMPRVGDEVLIYFINGDPDQPIVYGALHTKDTPKFINEVEDKYKTVLLRSHSFNQKSIMNYNEISIDDHLDKEMLFFKAQKDLNVEIGHKEQELEHYYKTSIWGKGYKKEFIEDGDNTLEMLKGKKIQSIGGDSITNIKKTESGGDYLLTVEDGKMIIKINGPCRISSVGLMELHSDEKILMTAPIIEAVGDEKISMMAPVVSVTGDEEIAIKSGMVLTMESDLEMNIKSGLELMIKSGLILNIISSLETLIKANMLSVIGSMEVTINGGMAVNVMGGLEVGIDGGLEVAINGGLSAELMSGLTAAVLGAVGASLAGGGLVAMMI